MKMVFTIHPQDWKMSTPPTKPGTTSLDTSLGDGDVNWASFQSLI
jgi:hypothetical protein